MYIDTHDHEEDTRQRFVTMADVENDVAESLGNCVGEFDIKAIARLTHEWDVEIDDLGRELWGTAGYYRCVDAEEFMEIAEANMFDSE